MKKVSPVFVMLKMTVLGILFNLILAAVYAALVTCCGLSFKPVSVVSLAANAAAVLAAGCMTAKSAGRKGLLWGGGAGLLFAAVVLAAGYMLTETPALGAGQAARLAVCVGAGCLGGVIGVNKLK